MIGISKKAKLWDKLTKELSHLNDNNYSARAIYNYITKYYLR